MNSTLSGSDSPDSSHSFQIPYCTEKSLPKLSQKKQESDDDMSLPSDSICSLNVISPSLEEFTIFYGGMVEELRWRQWFVPEPRAQTRYPSPEMEECDTG
ncbi:hypothetical protein J6590_058151 [Homalodisca vitripennis]|nr:hypothetical protein J6590_058151 [Homalodisca vitripennis]